MDEDLVAGSPGVKLLKEFAVFRAWLAGLADALSHINCADDELWKGNLHQHPDCFNVGNFSMPDPGTSTEATDGTPLVNADDLAKLSPSLEKWLTKQVAKAETPTSPELQWLDIFLPAVIGIATFGGGLTFTLVPAQLKPPSRFKEGTVTTFLSLAWVSFFFALALAVSSSLVLSFNRETIARRTANKPLLDDQGQERNPGTTEKLAFHFIDKGHVDLLLLAALGSAFFFLALVVVAYSRTVGIVAVSITALTIVIAAGLWVFQNRILQGIGGWLKRLVSKKSDAEQPGP